MRAPSKVLALFEPRSSGELVLGAVAEFIGAGAEVTLVHVAPQDTNPPNCTVYAAPLNDALRERASEELDEAARRAGVPESGTRLLVEGRDPSVEQLARDGFDLILLPARRRGRHPWTSGLAREGVEVRVLG